MKPSLRDWIARYGLFVGLLAIGVLGAIVALVIIFERGASVEIEAQGTRQRGYWTPPPKR